MSDEETFKPFHQQQTNCVSSEFVQEAGESIGIGEVSDAAVQELAEDVTYRLKSVIQVAKLQSFNLISQLMSINIYIS